MRIASVFPYERVAEGASSEPVQGVRVENLGAAGYSAPGLATFQLSERR